MSVKTVSDYPNSESAYLSTLADILDVGVQHQDGTSLSTGSGKSFTELLNYSFRITNPAMRLVHHRKKSLNLPSAIARFLWMMAGNDRLHDIAFYEEKVRFFSDDGIAVPGSNYGQRILRPRPGLNQLEAIIRRLKENPCSRRAAISIYHPEDAVRESKDIPCAFGLFYQIRNGELHATTIMRSNNAFVLLPYNLFEFSLLAEAIACETNSRLGTLTYFASSMHLFEGDLAKAREIVSEQEGAYVGPQMNAMPGTPAPLAQIRDLVILEAELRHGSAGITHKNIEDWISRPDKTLHPYWRQFYYLLLVHILTRSKNGTALESVYSVLDAPWNQLLRKADSPPAVMQGTNLEDVFGLELPEPPRVVPMLSTRRLKSVEQQAHQWETINGSVLPWQAFAAVQERFLTRLAARGNDEITADEFSQALEDIQRHEHGTKV